MIVLNENGVVRHVGKPSSRERVCQGGLPVAAPSAEHYAFLALADAARVNVEGASPTQDFEDGNIEYAMG